MGSSTKLRYLYTPFIHANECYGLITEEHVPGVDPNRYWVSNYSCVVYDAYVGAYVLPHTAGPGYHAVTLHTNKGFKSQLLHRLVGKVFIPGDFNLQINHKDGKKHNNTVDNLEWVTPRENLIHALETGLNKRGEDKPNAILTNDQARIICECLQNHMRISEILSVLGMENIPKNRDLIVDIKRRTTFTFISKDYIFEDYPLCEREFTYDQVLKICQLFQDNPNITYGEIFDILGLQASTPQERHNLLGKIGSIKLRKAYRDISKNFTW